MAIQTLSLETIKLFDEGRVAIALKKDLERAVLDCVDRPGEKRARTVLLEIQVTPRPENIQDGVIVANEANVLMKVKSKVPNRQTISRPMKMSRNGQLIFSDLTPENPDQTHIDELDPSGRVIRDRKAASAGD